MHASLIACSIVINHCRAAKVSSSTQTARRLRLKKRASKREHKPVCGHSQTVRSSAAWQETRNKGIFSNIVFRYPEEWRQLLGPELMKYGWHSHDATVNLQLGVEEKVDAVEVCARVHEQPNCRATINCRARQVEVVVVVDRLLDFLLYQSLNQSFYIMIMPSKCRSRQTYLADGQGLPPHVKSCSHEGDSGGIHCCHAEARALLQC